MSRAALELSAGRNMPADHIPGLKIELDLFHIAYDDAVLDKLVDLCIRNRLQADDIVFEWVAFMHNSGLMLNIDNLKRFEHQVLNERHKEKQSTKRDDKHNRTRDSLQELNEEEEEKENLLDSYSTPAKSSQKRLLTTAENPHSKRNAALFRTAARPGLPLSPASMNFKRRSGTQTTSIPAGIQTTSIPAGIQTTSIPAGIQTTSIPAGIQTTSIPAGIQTTSIPAGIQTTSIPAGIQSTSIPEGLTDLRILLLGSCGSGKSSAGEAILPKTRSWVDRAFQRSVQCEVRHGEAWGVRHLTVVESPGWWENSPLQDTSEMDKLEIQNSASLCFPGPHAVLLTVPLTAAFTKARRVAIEEHMTLLSQTVWSHTLVLFTHTACLQHLRQHVQDIEQHIEAQGEDLRWLVEKCGNRYLVFCWTKSRDALMTELLEKMEEMVAGNGGGHYEDDGDVSEKLSERKRNMVKRAQTLMTETQRQRTALEAQFEGKHQSLPAVRMMLVGGEQHQRSRAGNAILQRQMFGQTPLETKLTECVRQQRRVAERNVTVVICPDWSTTCPPSQKIKDVLQRGVTLCSPGPHAVLVTVPVRSSFSEANRRSVEELMQVLGELLGELLGDRVWGRALVLFTEEWWLGGRCVEEYIESEGEPLRWLLEKCGYRYHVLKTDSEDPELMEEIEGMVMRDGGHFGTSDSREDRSVGDTGHFKTECYTLSRKPRGRCLIINNEIFPVVGLNKRDGTQKDQEALEKVFSKLGFKVEVHRNMTASDIRRVLGDLGRQDFTEEDALVVCVLSHGKKGCVLGTDGETVLLHELKQPFTSESAPTLAGKPKLFFIQACQGSRLQRIQEDSVFSGESGTASHADFLMGMAAVEEFKTLRHVDTGAFYTQELCRQLEAGAVSGEDIHSVLTAVHREVGKGEYCSYKYKLMPEFRSSLTKKLVLDFI